MPATFVENHPPLQPRRNDRTHELALERVEDALRGLRFGEVTIIVQDGVVVQVERTEKLRLPRRER
jgi:hypothetical protein